MISWPHLLTARPSAVEPERSDLRYRLWYLVLSTGITRYKDGIVFRTIPLVALLYADYTTTIKKNIAES
jgi:hypothetical protein